MKITSPEFAPDEMIPSKYTCDGDNINPPLEISGVPPEAKSLCLVVSDPDAPGGDFVHWLLWNMEPETKEIEEGTIMIESVEGTNDAGKEGWTGPCPPSGTHRYEFRLYALDGVLHLAPGVDKSSLRNEIQGHILEEASLTGVYRKA